MDLFDFMQEGHKPLSERMRPNSLDNFIGQQHIIGENSLLRRAIKTDTLGSCVFYGPPGVGKTTLANIIANTTNCNFFKLNAVASGVAEAKEIIKKAEDSLKLYGKKTYLLLDECHRWNKAQSDCVLAAIEQGTIVFIGSTTENPYVNMTKAIISRVRIFEFKKISQQEILNALKLALKDKKQGLGNYDVEISEEALNHIAFCSDGDLRNGYNALELAVLSTKPNCDNIIKIDVDIAEQSIQKKALSLDDSLYYDILSAFCKSLRGSDSDAALYWSERLIQAGCDPMLILRRIIAHSAEDVGMANPMALVVANSALTCYEKVGMPEAKLAICQAIIYVCESSKSNSVYLAMSMAEKLVSEHKDDAVPLYLRSDNYKSEPVTGYKYPHDFGGWVEQTYLPESLKDAKIYNPSQNGYEKDLKRSKILKHNKDS
ncbi:MAG: replication-associated recombination protein A [Clostridia bacterium]